VAETAVSEGECLRGKRKLKFQPTTIRVLAKLRTAETVQFTLKAGRATRAQVASD